MDPAVEAMLVDVLEDPVILPQVVLLMEQFKEMMVVLVVLTLVKPEVEAAEDQPLVQLVVARAVQQVEMAVMV